MSASTASIETLVPGNAGWNTAPRRLALLLLVLAAGFASMFLLPRVDGLPEAGVRMELPTFLGGWYGESLPITDRERSILGRETQFARKRYGSTRGDVVDLSIVLSGEDMSASIHRPERCMPTQNFTIIGSRTLSIPLENGPALSVTRLLCKRPLFARDGKPILMENGLQLSEYSLLYYWFISGKETTESHTDRYFMDTRDRLLDGRSQSWAYVTVMSRIAGGSLGRNEEETDGMVQEFIRKILPVIQKPTVRVQ